MFLLDFTVPLFSSLPCQPSFSSFPPALRRLTYSLCFSVDQSQTFSFLFPLIAFYAMQYIWNKVQINSSMMMLQWLFVKVTTKNAYSSRKYPLARCRKLLWCTIS